MQYRFILKEENGKIYETDWYPMGDGTKLSSMWFFWITNTKCEALRVELKGDEE